ncbi:MAG TPA: LptF/LptG family permease [Myxococcaceae bacterium]|nr:LptF/LptG family permease [Myxococcaceae bacterium]
MRGLLFRHLVRRYMELSGTILGGLLTVFLIADFVDRAKSYNGPNWLRDVAVLYGYKALVAGHQLAPAALLLAAGALIAVLRSRGELSAIRALGFSPWTLYGPVLLVSATVALALVAVDEVAVGRASQRVDEITTLRFHRWGDWRSFFGRKQWFRRGDRILHLQAGDADQGFRGVTVLTLDASFALTERLEADTMAHLAGTTWRLTGVTVRRFDAQGGSQLRSLPDGAFDLGVDRSNLSIRPGRPEQMSSAVLRQQIRARRLVGLPDRLFSLALYNRVAVPMMAIPASLLALALALRSTRRGLTATLMQGLLVTLVLWGLMVVARGLVVGGRLTPAVAAWAPLGVLGVAALVLARWPLARPRGAGPRLGVYSAP